MSELAVSKCRSALKVYPKQIALQRLLFQLVEGNVIITDQVDNHVRSSLEVILQSLQVGDLESSTQNFEKLYRDYPSHPLILYHYGIYCLSRTSSNIIEDGLTMLNRSILTFPNFVEPYRALTRHYFLHNDFDNVILIAKEGIQYNSHATDLYHILAMSLKETDQLNDAIRTLEKGIKVDDQIPIDMYNDLGLLYTMDGQFTKSKKCYENALAIDPNYYQARFNFGLLLSRSGRINESIEIFESLPVLDRNAYEALLYSVACHPQKYRHLSKYLDGWSNKYAQHIKRPLVVSKQSKRQKIRIGYVSPDFRNHPVCYFMVGPYTHHSKSDFEVYSYYNGTEVDEYTHYIKKYSDVWRDVKSLTDQQLIDQINEDQIDILIDLAGHTSHNRLPVFVGKPAPIQVTYLGYLATTGIPQIDYRLIDGYAAPDNSTEELIKLPNCYLCYQPFRLDLPTSAHAYEKKQYVTFGSFHRLSKIHKKLIDVWSKILLQTPDSVILLKTKYIESPEIQESLLNQFGANGVTPQQVTFQGHSGSFVDHFSYYDEIDIMLDSFPYNGTTITCESLWMGVPVVVLAGDLHLSRVGVSINTNAGLSDLVAQNESEYIQIATELAKDKNRLAKYNQTLRDHFLHSNVCDPIKFTKNLERAYKHMYEKWISS